MNENNEKTQAVLRGHEPPPEADAYDTEIYERGARITCTRDDGEAQDEPSAEAVWAYVLGKALRGRGRAFARVLAESMVRMHIREGRLEVMIAERPSAIDVPLDYDALLIAFIEGWQMFAVDAEESRWADPEAVSIFTWEATLIEGDAGCWQQVREGTRSERGAATRARLHAAMNGLAQALSTIERSERAMPTHEQLALVAVLVTAKFVTRYEAETGARLPIGHTQATRDVTATLAEPWRSALLEAIGRAQEQLGERTTMVGTTPGPTLQ